MIEKLVLKTNQEDEPVPFEKLERMALKAWYDKTNEIIDAVNEIKQYLDWDEISGEITQNSTNNVKNLHLFQGNEQKAAEKCETADPYAEQCKWIGCLCIFKNKEFGANCFDTLIRINDFGEFESCRHGVWKYCEPVKPDDEIIFKGGKDE